MRPGDSNPSTDYADSFLRNLWMAVFLFVLVSPVEARADLSQKQARKVIQTIAGWSLPNDSVHVRSVKSSGTESAEVNAEMELVFRLTLRDGHWQLREIRTGQDRWERLDLIARAMQAELPADRCDGPSRLSSDLTTKLARCLVASLFDITLPSDDVRIKEISPFGLSIGSESAALVVALVQLDFRLARDASGWHVAELKSGSRDWVNVADIPSRIDQLKRSAATDELTLIASALDKFRRERGSFVVSDKESVLIDYLSPKYLARVIRVDPWQRPYQYEGQQDRYSLRSLGPDGKPNTPDDIVVSGP
ncbi:MAG TPA: type II secretion system protein GspG [Pyrinomonadaceae bacterium]|nr:type II secretion system protein GspG [Pyrinomonadaceae bacterium]